MAKDFWEWHELKSELEENKSDLFFHEREIWVASLGMNLGYEQDGKGPRFVRPVLIIKKFNQDIGWAIPLTSTIKPNVYYYPIQTNDHPGSLILSQIRLIDRKRLNQKMDIISEEMFMDVKQKLINFLSEERKNLPRREVFPLQTVEAEAVVLSIIPDRNTESIAMMAYNDPMLKIPTSVPEKGFYYHYKHDPAGATNNYAYEVMGVGCHTEDDCRPEDANLVVYRPLYESSVYKAGKLFDIRPLEMFMESVTKDGKTFPRFQKIAEPEVIAELEKIREQMYRW